MAVSIVASVATSFAVETGLVAVLGSELFVAGFGATLMAADALAATLIRGAFTLAGNALMSSLSSDEKKSSEITSQRAQGFLINSTSNIEPIPVVIGYRRVGGPRAFIHVSNTSASETAAEDFTIPGTPYQVTVANSANFVDDVGVSIITGWTPDGDAATTQALTKVAGAPAVGQYSVASGVYTFNSADAGKSITITYTWSNANGDHKFLNTAVVFSEGPIKAIDRVFFDDLISTDTKYTNKYKLEKYTGLTNQPASPLLMAQAPGSWTSAHQGKQLAYVAAQFTFNTTAYKGSPTLTADLRGILMYDTRTSQTKFSTNPAVAIRNYLTNTLYGKGIATSLIDDTSFEAAADYCDERVDVPDKSWTVTVDASSNVFTMTTATADDWTIQTGDGIRFTTSDTLPAPLVAGTTYYATRIMGKTFKVAANISEAHDGTTIDITSTGTGTHAVHHYDEPRYSCNGVINVDETLFDNLLKLLSSCRGMLIFSGGKYRLLIDKAESTPAFTFDEDNIVGNWEIRLPSRRERFNRVTGSFFNPNKNWQPDYAIHDSATFRTEDGGILIESRIELPFTSSMYMAHRLVQHEMKQSRYGIMIKFTAFQEGLACAVGDVVYLTHSTPGWTNKKFRILRMELMGNDEISVEAREYNDNVYTIETVPTAPNPYTGSLGDPTTVPDITGMDLLSGDSTLFIAGDGTVVPRIKVTWTAVSDAYVTEGGRILVQYKKSADSVWLDYTPADGAQSQTYIAAVDDGVAYDVRIKAENRIGARSVNWTTISNHTASGKTVEPDDVTGFSVQPQNALALFRWNPVADDDLAGYEIRYNPLGTTDWDSASVITRTTRGTQVTTGIVPPGSWTFLIKAVDTSDNYSVNADIENATITNPNYVVYSRSEEDYWELGTLTNLIIHSPTRALVLEGQTIANTAGWSTFDTSGYNVYAQGTYETPQIDIGRDGNVRTYAIVEAGLLPGATGLADPDTLLSWKVDGGSYSTYMPWDVGTGTARYAKYKLVVDRDEGKCKVTGFWPTVDCPYSSQMGSSVPISPAGTTITFDPSFFNLPTIVATPVGEGDYAVQISAQSQSSFTVFLRQGATTIDGLINWRADGAFSI